MRPRSLLLAPLLSALLLTPLAIAQQDAGTTATVDPTALVTTAVNAGAAHDWQLLAAALLCIGAWALRRFSAAPLLHTRAAALVTSFTTAVVGGLVPVLEAHAFTLHALVVALVTGVLSLIAMSNPSQAAIGPVIKTELTLDASQAQAVLDGAISNVEKVAGKAGPAIALLLVLLAPSMARALPVPGVAVPPGPAEQAAEAKRPQQQPPRPITYAADRGPLQVSPVLFAQLAEAGANMPNPPPDPVAATPGANDHAAKVQALAAGAAAAVEAAKAAPVPPGFWQTKPGQVLGVMLNVATVITTSTVAFAGVYYSVK